MKEHLERMPRELMEVKKNCYQTGTCWQQGILKQAEHMQIKYSPDADVLVIRLRDGKLVDSIDAAEGIIAHLDESGKVIEVEILDASKLVEIEELRLMGLQIARA